MIKNQTGKSQNFPKYPGIYPGPKLNRDPGNETLLYSRTKTCFGHFWSFALIILVQFPRILSTKSTVEYTIKLHLWQCIWLLCTFNYMYFVMKCGMIAALSRVYMVGNILATSYETEQSVRMVSCVPNTELYNQIDSWASIIAAYDSAP